MLLVEEANFVLLREMFKLDSILLGSTTRRVTELDLRQCHATRPRQIRTNAQSKLFSSVTDPAALVPRRSSSDLAWHGAMRLGGARLLSPDQVTFDQDQCVCRFNRGKGAVFPGPYTIRFAVPPMMARRIRTFDAAASRLPRLFAPQDQQRVPHARVLHAHGYAARSVHKGRRCFLADQGVSPEALMQLSGHLNATTLFRYIGRQAIHARNLVNEVTSAGGSIDPLPPTTHHDEPELSNKMGVWANQLQYKGRRFQKPPLSPQNSFSPRVGPRNSSIKCGVAVTHKTTPVHNRSSSPL